MQKALDEKRVDYEVVTEPVLPGRREELKGRSGQEMLPVIELEDGNAIREESKELAAQVRAGELA